MVRSKQKLKMKATENDAGGEDRINGLPDELIHKILSFLDAKVAVESSLVSKRWRHIWETLPFLHFTWMMDGKNFTGKPYEFLCNYMSSRDHQSDILEFSFSVKIRLLMLVCNDLIDYVISHRVNSLYLEILCRHKPYKLSVFSSDWLEKLTLILQLDYDSDSWDIPNLNTLELKWPGYDSHGKLSYSCFTSLPALTSLSLHIWDFSEAASHEPLSVPALTTLRMFDCILPRTTWNLPALLSLELNDVQLPKNMTDIFTALVNLQTLTLCFIRVYLQQELVITCPRLLNLTTRTRRHGLPCGKFVVLAPKLCNYTSHGMFSIAFEVSELENVYIKSYSFGRMMMNLRGNLEDYYQLFTDMFPGLGMAKSITFDRNSIKALSRISNHLAEHLSPFYNLKYVKLPQGYKESSMPSALKSYLLSGSPGATLITTLPQKNMIPQTEAILNTAQNMELQEPLKDSAMQLVNSRYLYKTLIFESVHTRVHEEHVVEISVIDAGRIRHIEAPVERTGAIETSSSSWGNRNVGLWRDLKVDSKFVLVLNHYMHKYPETFEHFTGTNKELCTMNLNMLCSTLVDFSNIFEKRVGSEIIGKYRNVFSDLQKTGFNLSWAMNLVDYMEQSLLSEALVPEIIALDGRVKDAKLIVQHLQTKLPGEQARVDDAKIKLHDLEILHAEKLIAIKKVLKAKDDLSGSVYRR